MFLLDTNVVSESRRLASGRADPAVVTWFAGVDLATAHISVMTLYELERGVLQMERRDPVQGGALRRWLDGVVLPGFTDRILPLTEAIAQRCAGLHVPDPQSERDAWIAATALTHGLTLVTRNVADFRNAGVAIIDPWEG
jgi:toxin FitB